MINNAVIFEEFGQVLVDFNGNAGSPLSLDSINNDTILNIYQDHLRDLKGYQHKILVSEEVPRLKIVNGVVHSKFNHFLRIMKQKENSQIVFMIIRAAAREVLEDVFNQLFNYREVEISIMEGITPDTKEYVPQLLTYQESSICSLVPRTEEVLKTFYFNRVFVK
jgi:hypothetical protein